MKYIITENKLPIYLLRRIDVIKDMLDKVVQLVFDEDVMPFLNFQGFLLSISEYVAEEIANEISGEDFVTVVAQIKQFIQTYFYEYLKERWESKQN